MTPQNELEVQGNFLTHPFADLAAEIANAQLHGSLRVSVNEKKSIFYFNKGRLVYCVSNARSSRFFDILLRRERITRDDLAKIPNFANDLECSGYLVDRGFLTADESDQIFIEQAQRIVHDQLVADEGDWHFSALARARDGLDVDVNLRQMLVDFARCLPGETVLQRFRSLSEKFARSETPANDILLTPAETALLEAVDRQPEAARDVIGRTPLGESAALQSLFVLWLGGFVDRSEWNPAFSDMKLWAIRGMHLELKREARMPSLTPKAPEKVTRKDVEPGSVEPPQEIKITVDDYLARVEGAATYYDMLGVDPTVELIEIKKAYLNLAKSFHPDHFHKAGGEILNRVQAAFTRLAQAHETLRLAETREHYDFKVRKELAEKSKQQAAGTYDEMNGQLKQAVENFDRGFSLLMEGDVEPSLPFLARAVHFDAKNARYHAYYGKALSADEKKRHNAEAEMQAAVRLDPDNPTYRILLAEFFIQVNLKKRAEGELNRLLAVFPSNREAQDLLASLKK